ncbi:2-oxoacid:acceptor oxidoreductase subunit alpha [Limnochorda pilosa]|uniref:2-oxoglutarate ferredoxin oxidoreductase subunit alpha n=1 Tax=Limnochorda pilosa TaxID=1555112 RepID=A0A0K2SQ25_LIMPI|nr:2-oxoacid:acceptor oxidoreductase subunit alpha [Limnochorda pilosa]BAS29220.1 2-oxoglutarate ferredoxin oxidoreductase subunit alpha [Limnochorda pilosa]
MSTDRTDIAWRIGGPQGKGVDTAAGIFGRACAAGGFHVFGRREYYSNIMGRHSYFDVRVTGRPVGVHRDRVDLLVTFDTETLVRHAVSVAPGGVLLHDASAADVAIDAMGFLDDPLQEELAAYLAERDLPPTTAGLLEDARRRGVTVLPVSYGDLTEALTHELGASRASADRMLNTVAVALSAALIKYDPDRVKRGVALTFGDRSKLVEMNRQAVDLAYAHARRSWDLDAVPLRLGVRPERPRRLFVTGTQAVAMGKIAGGLAFQTYYPISPATDESVYLEAHATFPTTDGGQGSVLVWQTEDELAAVTAATGAALTGARSATATSGPGFSLMTEGIGWAGINEVPLVVTVYQRGGPATGLPTRTEQGDLQFAVHGGHGDFPRIVLASGDVTEAFQDAAQAFSYAERYQTVVIHLMDKALASTTLTTEPFDTSRLAIDRGLVANPASDGSNGTVSFPRFRPSETGLSPRPYLGQPGGMHWLTGAEHTELGRVTEDPITREQQVEKRLRKLQLAAREIPAEEKLRLYGDASAPLTLVSWGSNKAAILEVLERLAEEGVTARHIQLRLLWPFPSAELEPLLATARPLVAVETNATGQMARLLREQTGRAPDHLVLKYSGRPISVEQLLDALHQILSGAAGPRLVIRNPYE